MRFGIGSGPRAVIGSLVCGLLLSFSGLMTSGCTSDKKKDNGDDMASDDTKKKKKKKKKKPKANPDDSGAGASGDGGDSAK